MGTMTIVVKTKWGENIEIDAMEVTLPYGEYGTSIKPYGKTFHIRANGPEYLMAYGLAVNHLGIRVTEGRDVI